MDVVPIPDGIGVELRDVDLTAPLDEADQAVVRAAFLEHSLLLVRDQVLSGEDHDRFIGYLGPLQMFAHGSRHEFISNVQEDNPNRAGVGRLLFHNDGAFREDLRAGTSLYAINVSPTSPPTAFANGVRAYEALPSDLQREVEKLSAVHILDLDPRQEYRRTREADIPAGHDISEYTHAAHPVVLILPYSGRKALFVSEFYTSHILEFGPSSEEGEALLQRLFGVLYGESNTYAHHYQNGDLVVWDNLSIQHARTGAIDDAPRHLRRLVLESLDW